MFTSSLLSYIASTIWFDFFFLQLCMQLCILLPFVSSTYQVSVLSLYTSFNFFNITWKWPLTDWKSIITFCSAHCYRLLNQTNPLLMTARNHLLSKTDCVPLRLLARSEMFCRAREFNFFSMGDKFIFLMSQLTAIFCIQPSLHLRAKVI